MSDIRYYKMRTYAFTNSHYYCENNGFVVTVGEDGEISKWDNPGLGGESYPEIKGFIPDAYPIEERWINATDRPSVKLKYPELHPVNDVES